MNYKKILILSATVAIPMLFADFTYKKVAGPHAGSTGSPGDNTCAKSGCHSGSPVSQNNNIVNQLVFPTLDSTYVPGQTYLVKVKVAKAGIKRFGFEIQALKDATNRNIGTWGITQSTRTQIISHTVGADTRYSVTHKAAGTPELSLGSGNNEWQFNWTAPAINEGNITLYYATNCTNDNQLASGDLIYTNTFKLKPNTGNSISEFINEESFVAFYNTSSSAFDLKYNLKKDESVFVSIIDASGKEIFKSNPELKSKGQINDQLMPLNSISSGIYFVNLFIGNTQTTKKISVIR